MADFEKKFEVCTPRPREKARNTSRLFHVSSGDSTEAVANEKREESSLSDKVESFNRTPSLRNPVLRKPGSNISIIVDEIDEECVAIKGTPSGFTRRRSSQCIYRVDDEEEEQIGRRSRPGFRGYGKDEEDMIIRRVRARSISHGFPLALNVLTNEEISELSSSELARRICPEGFHRYRRIGPNSMDRKQFNAMSANEKLVGKESCSADEPTDSAEEKHKSTEHDAKADRSGPVGGLDIPRRSKSLVA